MLNNKNIWEVPAVQKFISENLNADLPALMLKKSPFPELSMAEIVQQIKGRRVAERKFPFLLAEGIIFPANLNLEQASSGATAQYKSGLVKGHSMADLTAGFGIDAYFLSSDFSDVTLIEQNTELLETVRHNWEILEKNAEFLNKKLEDFLAENQKHFDLVYLDPARRDENRNKVFLLEDLSPNLLEIQDSLLKISDKFLIKLSPLIDISYLISVLKNIAEIHIVALKNDVKEILILVNSKNPPSEIAVKCVNLETIEPVFQFNFGENDSAVAEYSEPENFIYIPNNAVLKSCAFNLVAEKFNLKKLHPNTHIYTSEYRLDSFPGRILEMETIQPKELKKAEKFNIISKNYPLKPEEIRKKYKLKDGGGDYLIFTQSRAGKLILKSK